MLIKSSAVAMRDTRFAADIDSPPMLAAMMRRQITRLLPLRRKMLRHRYALMMLSAMRAC